MQKLGMLALAMAIVACTESPSAPATEDDAPIAFAAVTDMENVKMPFSVDVFIDCAADGAGEVVRLTGTLHSMFRITLDANGGAHVKFLDQPQRLSGRGLVTGALYQGTGVTQDMGNVAESSLPAEFTFINNYRIIGQGPGNNFMAHTTSHYTMNANGDVTANVTVDSFSCR